MLNHYIKLRDCTIHALDTGPRGNSLPFVYVPGIAGIAEEGTFFFDSFPDRRCISLSMRGRGQSSTPASHYAISDHAHDIANAIDYFGLTQGGYHLHGYSIAVMYVLSFVTLNWNLPATLILGDHPATVEKLPLGWAQQFSANKIRGKCILDNIRMDALSQIEKDSKNESLLEGLLALGFHNPVLLLYGGAFGPVPSRIADHDIQQYRSTFRKLHSHGFPGEGHFFRDTQRSMYISVIHSFMSKCDV